MTVIIFLLISFSTYWFLTKSNFGKEFHKKLLEEKRLEEDWMIIKVVCSIFWWISWTFIFPIIYFTIKRKS